MSGHDPLCQTRTDHYPSWCDCPRVQAIRADERAERGLANEPQGLALAEMLLHASRATEAKVLADLRAKVKALPVAVVDLDPDPRRGDAMTSRRLRLKRMYERHRWHRAWVQGGAVRWWIEEAQPFAVRAPRHRRDATGG